MPTEAFFEMARNELVSSAAHVNVLQQRGTAEKSTLEDGNRFVDVRHSHDVVRAKKPRRLRIRRAISRPLSEGRHL
jgi:hypothetical protein